MTSRHWGERVNYYFDDRYKTVVLKCVTLGRGVLNCPNLRDVIYERPLSKLNVKTNLHPDISVYFCLTASYAPIRIAENAICL